MRKRILTHILPGLLLVILAFFSGSQRDPTLGLLGFLSFFVVGVTLLREGIRGQGPQPPSGGEDRPAR